MHVGGKSESYSIGRFLGMSHTKTIEIATFDVRISIIKTGRDIKELHCCSDLL